MPENYNTPLSVAEAFCRAWLQTRDAADVALAGAHMRKRLDGREALYSCLRAEIQTKP